MTSLLNRSSRGRQYMGGGIQTTLRGIPLALAVAVAGYLTMHTGHADTVQLPVEAESGVLSANAIAGDPAGASGGSSVLFQGASQGSATTNLPPQPAGLVYDDPPANTTSAYAHPGALLVAGRTGADNQLYKDVSAAGGSVLLYLDVMINGNYGPYHSLLLDSSACGPAVPLWPGSPQANTYGKLNDFRVGGVLQSKLECVLEKMVQDNPHMAGWFADDLGSRSWFPDITWESWSAADQQAYRDGAVALTQTFRKVANKHGLIFLVNGTWGGGTVAAAGGGYPDASKSGNALADGGVVEHHPVGDLPYFQAYGCSPQWASQSPVTKGKAINFVISSSASEMQSYAQTNCFAYLTTQTDYGQAPTPWTTFHSNGLPSKAGAAVQ